MNGDKLTKMIQTENEALNKLRPKWIAGIKDIENCLGILKEDGISKELTTTAEFELDMINRRGLKEG